MPADVAVPDQLRDLLERPLFAALATVHPDGAPQVSPMWFDWDGEHLLFTHTTYRRKLRNLEHNPAAAITIFDPDRPYRYIEVRAVLDRVDPDPTGAFYVHLAQRYSSPHGTNPPPDAADRVVLRLRPTAVLGR